MSILKIGVFAISYKYSYFECLFLVILHNKSTVLRFLRAKNRTSTPRPPLTRMPRCPPEFSCRGGRPRPPQVGACPLGSSGTPTPTKSPKASAKPYNRTPSEVLSKSRRGLSRHQPLRSPPHIFSRPHTKKRTSSRMSGFSRFVLFAYIARFGGGVRRHPFAPNSHARGAAVRTSIER